MKIKTDRIQMKRLLAGVGFLVLCMGLTASTCTPDRNIDIVVGVDVITTFEAQGSQNQFQISQTVDVDSSANIQKVLSDNGFDGLVVANIQSAFYEVTRKDPVADRTISAVVKVAAAGDTARQLLSLESVAVNDDALQNWTAVPLSQGGVDLINQVVANYLQDVYDGHNPPRLPVITYTVDGTSAPADQVTNFEWKLKIRMTLVGKKKLTVFQP